MVQIVPTVIDVAKTIAMVVDPGSGAVNVFIGTTRNNAGGRAVTMLEYEAYDPMAIEIMRRLEAEALRRWHLTSVVIVHRTGRVPVGEASVVIAVSAPHRSATFDACRWLIDTLKKEVPIWKRETFVDGTTAWVPQSTATTPAL